MLLFMIAALAGMVYVAFYVLHCIKNKRIKSLIANGILLALSITTVLIFFFASKNA